MVAMVALLVIGDRSRMKAAELSMYDSKPLHGFAGARDYDFSWYLAAELNNKNRVGRMNASLFIRR